MKNANSLLKQVYADRSLTGIALEVFEIFCKEDGLTAGEVFIAYEEANPDTERSRNEIAKRVSDLVNYGVLRRAGTTVCPLTFRTVSKYILTGELPNRNLAVPSVRGNLAVQAVHRVSIEEISVRDRHLATLRALASRSRFLLRFRKFLTASFAARTVQTLDALEHAIYKLEVGG